MSASRQVSTRAFLDHHPVFRLDQAARAFGHHDRRTTLDRLRYHVLAGRLKQVTRGVYARVPPGVSPMSFQADAFLVAAAVRRDAVFSHHSALELLGSAHSEWNRVTVLTARRRRPLRLDGQTVTFLAPPASLVRSKRLKLGVRLFDRNGQSLRGTGPERTLLDGFRNPEHAGGPAELVQSAAGFPVLDLDLLWTLLEAYGEKGLFAATGWFLERYQRSFFVPDDFLKRLARRRPASPLYMLRGRRGGRQVTRWNLILPEELVSTEPDES